MIAPIEKRKGGEGDFRMLTGVECVETPELLRTKVETVCSMVKMAYKGADAEVIQKEALEAIARDDLDAKAREYARKLLSRKPVQGEFGYFSEKEVYQAVGRRWEEDSGIAERGPDGKLPKTHLWAPFNFIAWDMGLIQRLFKKWDDGRGVLVYLCMLSHMTVTKGRDYGEIAVFPTVIIRETSMESGIEWTGKFPAKTVNRIQEYIVELGLLKWPGGKGSKLGYKPVRVGDRVVRVRRFFMPRPGAIEAFVREHGLVPTAVELSRGIEEANNEVEVESEGAGT